MDLKDTLIGNQSIKIFTYIQLSPIPTPPSDFFMRETSSNKVLQHKQDFIGYVFMPGTYNKISNLYIMMYEGVSKSFQNRRLKQELKMVQLSATRCSCLTIL
jgi:hypothetical protein